MPKSSTYRDMSRRELIEHAELQATMIRKMDVELNIQRNLVKVMQERSENHREIVDLFHGLRIPQPGV